MAPRGIYRAPARQVAAAQLIKRSSQQAILTKVTLKFLNGVLCGGHPIAIRWLYPLRIPGIRIDPKRIAPLTRPAHIDNRQPIRRHEPKALGAFALESKRSNFRHHLPSAPAS